jgi:DNA helicase-2/ATP-dependent DNA helicase PcrA
VPARSSVGPSPDDLDPGQRRAATFGIAPGAPPHPPLRIAAGAGTGKTTTLAHRVAELILAGADPGRILLLTFTRRAAEELCARVAAICERRLGVSFAERQVLPWSGTFHAVALRILRAHAPALGLDPAFTLLDRSDAAELLDLLRGELRLADGGVRFPQKGTCLEICGYTLNAGLPLGRVLADRWPWCVPVEDGLRRLFDAYAARKAAWRLLDYDDLLVGLATVLDHPVTGDAVRALFDFVLVDEYQDTSPLQARIVRGLRPSGEGLTVVGDDQQAIYGFRAASVRNMLDFPSLFPTPAVTLTLERNWRSTEPVLRLANAVQAEAAERVPKSLRGGGRGGPRPQLLVVADETAQAREVVTRVLALCEEGVRLHDQAVLVRSSHHTTLLELELARRRVPYRKYGGLRLLEAAHVKDFLSFLRFAENPRDRLAGRRMLRQLPGIGPAFADAALDRLEAAGFEPAALALLPPPAPARGIWAEFVALLGELAAADAWPEPVHVLRRFLAPLHAARFDDHEERGRDLDQLELAAAMAPSRREFLAGLALEPPLGSGAEAADPRLDEDWLVLSTIHSAKGREWEAVFLLWLVDGWIPSDMATGSAAGIEEERRLFYVAVTRARRRLFLLQPLRCHVHAEPRRSDRYVRAAPSRFLTPGVRRELDQVPCGGSRGPAATVSVTPAAADPGGEVLLDLAERLRGMWRRA